MYLPWQLEEGGWELVLTVLLHCLSATIYPSVHSHAEHPRPIGFLLSAVMLDA